MKMPEFLSNPEKRQRTLLFLMVGLLVLAMLFFYLSLEKPAEYQAFMMCTKCRALEFRDIIDIQGTKCSKCGGDMGFAYKCEACRYEFPYRPLNAQHLKDMDINTYRKYRLQESKCPNCFSTQTHEMDTR